MNYQSTKENDAISSNAMAATSHPLATEEALKILKKVGMLLTHQLQLQLYYPLLNQTLQVLGEIVLQLLKWRGKNLLLTMARV